MGKAGKTVKQLMLGIKENSDRRGRENPQAVRNKCAKWPPTQDDHF
jgi:hypothetical protein